MTVKPNDGAPAAGGGMTIPRDGRVPSRPNRSFFFVPSCRSRKFRQQARNSAWTNGLAWMGTGRMAARLNLVKAAPPPV